MRNKNSIQFTTVIILLSFLTVFGEFALLYAMSDDFLATLIGCGIVLFISIILLFTAYNFEAVFIYMLLNVVLSSLLAAYSFWEISYFYYSVENYELWMVLINFAVPCLLCLVCNLFDQSHSIANYRQFARNSSLLFLVYYVCIFIYIEFTPHIDTIWSNGNTNLIPFYTIAGYIEDYIYQVGSLKDIFYHLLISILLYLPAGFLLGICMRRTNKFLRLLVALLLPLITEGIQYLTHVNTLNVDDVIYGFLGGILGQLLFFLLNALFLRIKGQEFLEEERSYRSTLHF